MPVLKKISEVIIENLQALKTIKIHNDLLKRIEEIEKIIANKKDT